MLPDAGVQRVKADAGSVQDEERVGLVAVQFGRECAPLRFTAGELVNAVQTLILAS